MYLLECFIEHPVRTIDQTFTYYSEEPVSSGVRVQVDFNGRKVTGFVDSVQETDGVPEGIKPVLSVLDQESLITEELHALARYMKDITVSTTIACYQAMLPAKIKPRGEQKKVVMETWALPCVQEVALTPRQLEAFLFVQKNQPLLYSRLRRHFPSQAKVLADKGAVILEQRERQAALPVFREIHEELTLTEDQKKAMEAIHRKPEGVFLLHGMTGSGKTEIYLHLAREALQEGKQVLILVPEIALTPQMIERVRSRFGSALAIYHSGLNSQEKYEQYRMVRMGKASIVVGTRSAVFLPFRSLGLIVMDEEQDSSYKQDSQPAYHCRDIAIWRAAYHHCRIILGSATPSLESYARAIRNVYTLVELSHRVNRQMPDISIVSLKKAMRSGDSYIITKELEEKMRAHLEAHKQVILLLNRRGFHTSMRCTSCAQPLKCRHCDITLSYHRSSHQLVCHTCGYTTRFPKACPSCGSVEGFSAFGFGTERLEMEVKNRFEGVKVLRMDADTVSAKNGHEKILGQFGRHEADVLVGTQMIAKGLDYPDVTLVGILNGDEGLQRTDYLSCEMTFDLLMQAAGRAGRSESAGEVVLQVFDPDHYAVRDAAAQDYRSFFHQEMSYRHAASQPPYTFLIALTVSSLKQDDAERTALRCMETLKGDFRKLGVIQLPRRRDRFYARILLKGKNLEEMRAAVRNMFTEEPSLSRKDIRIDVSPMNLE